MSYSYAFLHYGIGAGGTGNAPELRPLSGRAELRPDTDAEASLQLASARARLRPMENATLALRPSSGRAVIGDE